MLGVVALGLKLDGALVPAHEALDDDLLAEPGDDGLAVSRIGVAPHGEDVARPEAHLVEAVAVDPHEPVGPGLEALGERVEVVETGGLGLVEGDDAHHLEPVRVLRDPDGLVFGVVALGLELDGVLVRVRTRYLVGFFARLALVVPGVSLRLAWRVGVRRRLAFRGRGR